MPMKEKATLIDVISSAATIFAQALKPQVSVSAANNSTIVNQNYNPVQLHSYSPAVQCSNPVNGHTGLQQVDS